MDRALKQLEAEAIYIFRETACAFQKPVMLYSVGKDSSVMVRLAQKAFWPDRIPFPLLHIDTGFKFPEMYEFRDKFCSEHGLNLIIERNTEWIDKGCDPEAFGRDACCGHLKTEALLAAVKKHGFDAGLGGARREEEKSRAKERIFSIRDQYGQWDPKMQRPELWSLFNAELLSGQTMRVFPLSNWTELDVWRYIEAETIPVVPLYFAAERAIFTTEGSEAQSRESRRDNKITDGEDDDASLPSDRREHQVAFDGGAEKRDAGCRTPQGTEAQRKGTFSRYRSLGCVQCSGPVPSDAKTVKEIIEELKLARYSERQTRKIDYTSDASMEEKKKQGYF